MNEKEIILSSYSIGDLTLKLFGYANAVTKEKTIKFLETKSHTNSAWKKFQSINNKIQG